MSEITVEKATAFATSQGGNWPCCVRSGALVMLSQDAYSKIRSGRKRRYLAHCTVGEATLFLPKCDSAESRKRTLFHFIPLSPCSAHSLLHLILPSSLSLSLSLSLCSLSLSLSPSPLLSSPLLSLSLSLSLAAVYKFLKEACPCKILENSNGRGSGENRLVCKNSGIGF